MLLSSNDILNAFDQGAIYFNSPAHSQGTPEDRYGSQRERLKRALGDNPNSVDVSLGNKIKDMDYVWWKFWQNKYIKRGGMLDLPKNYMLAEFKRGKFYLAHTHEFIGTTDKPWVDTEGREHWLAPMYDTRSTLARLGLPTHLSAGFGDCGFHGRWALEIMPAQDVEVDVYSKVGQVYFYTLSSRPNTFYSSEYSELKWSFSECVLPRGHLAT